MESRVFFKGEKFYSSQTIIFHRCVIFLSFPLVMERLSYLEPSQIPTWGIPIDPEIIVGVALPVLAFCLFGLFLGMFIDVIRSADGQETDQTLLQMKVRLIDVRIQRYQIDERKALGEISFPTWKKIKNSFDEKQSLLEKWIEKYEDPIIDHRRGYIFLIWILLTVLPGLMFGLFTIGMFETNEVLEIPRKIVTLALLNSSGQ